MGDGNDDGDDEGSDEDDGSDGDHYDAVVLVPATIYLYVLNNIFL